MKTTQYLLTFAMLAASATAFADAPPVQNHHCKLADGSMDLKKTHKQCDAAKGTWAKDADPVKPPATTPTTTAKPVTPPPAQPAPVTPKPTTPATPPPATPAH